jgi:hypothetical protein
MGDLGIDQVLMMLIQEDQKQEQEIRRDRLRSLTADLIGFRIP